MTEKNLQIYSRANVISKSQSQGWIKIEHHFKNVLRVVSHFKLFVCHLKTSAFMSFGRAGKDI